METIINSSKWELITWILVVDYFSTLLQQKELEKKKRDRR